MIDIEIYTTRLQVGKNTWNEYEKRAKKLRDVICDERRRRWKKKQSKQKFHLYICVFNNFQKKKHQKELSRNDEVVKQKTLSL